MNPSSDAAKNAPCSIHSPNRGPRGQIFVRGVALGEWVGSLSPQFALFIGSHFARLYCHQSPEEKPKKGIFFLTSLTSICYISKR
jgi:hypothetical protein